MSEREIPMTLHQAMLILCEVHTRDDPQLGFYVQMGALPYEFGGSIYQSHSGDYTEAWRVLRNACGLSTARLAP